MTVEKVLIGDALKKNFVPYALEVILSRAIPSIDGFKPSQRKLLYMMHLMGLSKDKKGKTKSANIVGQTMRLNPHGDQAIYKTMVRMSEGNESLLHPFVASKGNFGKRVSKDMKYAAARYTEAGLSPIGDLLFRGLNNGEIVPFVDNYDGTMREPTLLPTKLPFIVLNPVQGTAVGYASMIPSYNLEEVSNYTIGRLKGRIATKNAYKHIKGPDFPTGGRLIEDKEKFKEILETGRGAYTLRARYEFIGNTIEITEIPYTTTVEDIIKKIVYYIKRGTKFTEIKDIRDETGIDGLKIAIDVKQGTNIEVLMDQLFDKTPLEDNFNCNFNVLLGGGLRKTNFIQLIEKWIEYRVLIEEKALDIELKDVEFKLHRMAGLRKILVDIDKVVKVIRETKKSNKVVPNLMKKFDLSEIQADYIADIKLRNLNKEYILNKQKDRKTLEDRSVHMKHLLSDRKALKKELAKEIKKIKDEFKLERKTEIVSSDEIIEVDEEDKIDDYNLEVFLTEQGYFKKVKLTSLRGNDEQKTKKDDKITQNYEGTNMDELLLFSNKAMVYKRLVRDLPICKASELGIYLKNELEMDEDEEIIYMVLFNPEDPKGHIVFTYSNGKIAKVPIESFITKTNRRYLKNAYSESYPLVSIYKIDEPTEITTFRKYKSDYRALTVDSDDISEKKTRSVNGVTVHSLRSDSECIYSCISSEAEKYDLNLTTSRFKGKLNRAGGSLGSTYITRLEKMINENKKSLTD